MDADARWAIAVALFAESLATRDDAMPSTVTAGELRPLLAPLASIDADREEFLQLFDLAEAMLR